jgi:hypothetical protein
MSTRWGRCTLPYSPKQLFDLAADVERYPDFVPWWVAARVWKREGNVYYTDRVIGFAMVRKRFRSKTILHRPERIDVTSTDGPVTALTPELEGEARCVSSARRDLRGGSGVTRFPTVTVPHFKSRWPELTERNWHSCTTKVFNYRPTPDRDKSKSSNQLERHHIQVPSSLITYQHG